MDYFKLVIRNIETSEEEVYLTDVYYEIPVFCRKLYPDYKLISITNLGPMKPIEEFTKNLPTDLIF